MAMAIYKAVVLMAFMAAALSSVSIAGVAPLTYDFYIYACPKAEETVRYAVEDMIHDDPTIGAALIRLFFHDCFVRGCDASILLNGANTEKTAIPLRGYEAVDKIKAAVEAVCPGVVSCADILAFAARESAMLTGSFTFAMPAGRRDGLQSVAGDVFQSMPSPDFQLRQLELSFGAVGLGVDDLVALSGAHSFGLAHCSSVTGRLYPTVDPTMNATYAAALIKLCPQRSSNQISNNLVTDPNALTNQYYRNVAAGQVLFTSDQTLASSSDIAAKVADNAANPVAWMARFAAALVKMGGIKVLTGTAGEVRKVCYATNSAS